MFFCKQHCNRPANNSCVGEGRAAAHASGGMGADAPTKEIVAMASILLLGGVIPLAAAYLSQVLLDLHPCHFCMLQRYPYGVAALAGLVLLLVTRMGLRWRFTVAVGILSVAASGVLGMIHTAIERGWLAYKGGCVAEAVSDGSLEALRAAIARAPLVACNEVSASLMGLSMASWNVLWAACVLVLIALQYRFEWRLYSCPLVGKATWEGGDGER